MTKTNLPAKLRKELDAAFGGATRILVTAHVRPDGDAIGSVLALGLSLQAAGKEVVMALQDGVPAYFHFLEGYDQIVTHHGGGFDLVVTLDSGDRERVGLVLNGLDVDVNIDHHATNPGYGRINWIETQSVATCEMLALLLPALDLPMPQHVLAALMTGLITDSQGFRTLNTAPGSLRTAADLMERGADLPDLYYKALTRKGLDAIRYWGQGLIDLKLEDEVVWCALTLEGRKKAGYPGRDDADLVNFLARIEEAAVAVVLIEQKDKTIKISWRAKAGYNVAELAQAFGGGGHVAAAGATFQGSLTDAQKAVIEATRAMVRAVLREQSPA
jgi:phosphoesterase RecJ-like protein